MCRRAKTLFKRIRNSLGGRGQSKKLREEGFDVGRYRTQMLTQKLGQKVQQRVKHKATTKRKHNDAVADNSIRTLSPRLSMVFGLTMLPTCAQVKAGFTWLWLWISIRGVLWVGVAASV